VPRRDSSRRYLFCFGLAALQLLHLIVPFEVDKSISGPPPLISPSRKFLPIEPCVVTVNSVEMPPLLVDARSLA